MYSKYIPNIFQNTFDQNAFETGQTGECEMHFLEIHKSKNIFEMHFFKSFLVIFFNSDLRNAFQMHF